MGSSEGGRHVPSATLATAKMQGIAMTTAYLNRGRDQCAISSAMVIHMTENSGAE